jgi:hypothetical protein
MSNLENPTLAAESTSPEHTLEQLAQVLMRRVFRILQACGIATSKLAVLASQALGEITPIPEVTICRFNVRQTLACCDVVLKWRRDCRFLDFDGQPRQLSIDEGSSNFRDLVISAAPGSDARELLQVMVDLGVVRICNRSSVELISESVVTSPGREQSALASESVLEHVCGYLGSVEFNLFDKPTRTKGKFERACYAWIPRAHVPILEKLVSARGQAFVDVIDEWLSRRSLAATEGSDSVLVGAGAYVFVRNRLGS